jgi:glycosyltransferase involved in cell wall biosynthesis
MKKLAIITTHPIQYYAPVFKLLAERNRIDIKVFYTLGDAGAVKHDHGFNQAISWDIPLVKGYLYEWVKNTAAKPGSHHFKGIVNPEIGEQVMAWAPDAVLVYGWAYSGHLKALRYFKNRLPVYFKGDSTLLNEPTGLKKISKYVLLRWVYQHVDHAFYNGINNKKYFEKYGLKYAQLTFAPHAIDNSRFEVSQPEKVGKLRLSLNLTDDDILVLYAGKFDPVKNLSLLLTAFVKLTTNNVHLLLAGDGAEHRKLAAIAAASGREAYIHFTGFKNQSYMPVLYQAANLVCLPSVSETWGLAINEAMACHKAVLVSDKVGCAADLVQQDHNGGIFKSNNEQDLLVQLTRLTASKELLNEYGANSGRIIRDWNFIKVAEAIEHQILT